MPLLLFLVKHVTSIRGKVFQIDMGIDDTAESRSS